jgi:hypothetical protein
MAEFSIYVTTSLRSRGIGMQLLQHVLDFVRSSTKLEWLHSFFGKSNHVAIKGWQQVGAYVTGEFPPTAVCPSREHLVLMSLPIGGPAQDRSLK